MRFHRVMEAFDADVALARGKRCSESSGSEHSHESSTDLSELVLSFMEDNERSGDKEDVVRCGDRDEKGDENEVEKIGEWCDNEKSEMLNELFGGNEGVNEDERDAKEIIRKEVEVAIGDIVKSDSIDDGFKRKLMSHLREKCFDAGEY
ncbi:hypothetical protein TSUD_379750 [Trifolium subterraneum]|uniref:DUF506 family protein n=1 Tax=Trifolium subterraneum TaxID=3900 RepID=A0A2Z6N1L4_TRISU|nr:hypothetical protein TSUD_379750 [Trifolium subterraneum]